MALETEEYCATAAKAAGEPLLGTAPRVDVWLMLEYQPTWHARALEDNDLPHAVNRWLQQLVEHFAGSGLKARPQFIRKRRATDDSVTLFLAHNRQLRHWQLKSLAALTELDPLRDPGELVTEPQYFVCTNGRRDRCCSRFGLPVYGALRDLVGERAWETTHVGGHRFAANVVVLPQGALYGNIDVMNVGRFVTDIEQNQLSLPFLRGRSAYPPVAQAAESAVDTDAELIACGEYSATFRTATGDRTINVRPADNPLTVIPSCGAAPEMVYPLRIAEPDQAV